MKKILLVFAHPDDESFIAAGTAAKYIANGWQADVICATAGSEEPSDEIRKKELEKAGTIIGLSSVAFLGYKDGSLSDLTPGTLEDKIFRVMDKLLPDVIITFELASGVNNHPDHKKISLSTTYAFQKYAAKLGTPKTPGRRQSKVSFEESQGLTDTPKLYYALIPETSLDFMKKQHTIPQTSFGKPWVGISDKFVTTVIDIRRFRSMKIKALQVYKSQMTEVDKFLASDKNPLLSQEYFILRMEGTSEIFMGKNDKVSNKF